MVSKTYVQVCCRQVSSICTTMHGRLSSRCVSRHWPVKWEVLEHPAYSPDLSSFDYHIFGLQIKSLKGQRDGFAEILLRYNLRQKLLPLAKNRFLAEKTVSPSVLDFRSTTWPATGTPPSPISPPGQDIDYSSDFEGENMDTHLERHRTPSPSISPPEVRELENDFNQVDTSPRCKDFLTELHQLMAKLDNFYFNNEEQKNQYHDDEMKIFEDSAALYRDLAQAEKEHFDAVVCRGQQRIALEKKKMAPSRRLKVGKRLTERLPLHLPSSQTRGKKLKK
ncbi:hypothetical protein TNIN_353161 [Trichonephila inaurata madagascariensis]|uniref:Uncharacterized protein n=1 Tax=Trichonephila inaurata madagascariensis TaxID=2747483 RepID=A0A8X6M975_9ARAC|nr:hypothetical protein TNIN_353161 [Trichonephila inaurata madagascariensis]